MSVTKNENWETRLTTAYQQMVETSVPAILDFAKEVAAFKADCKTIQGGTDFSKKVKELFGMSRPVAEKWALIGESEKLFAARTSLPPSMETLYMLTTLPEDTLDQAIDDGTVNSDMTRVNVRALKPAAPPKEVTLADAKRRIEVLGHWIKNHIPVAEYDEVRKYLQDAV